ncbi:hypothetical protein F5878DRAFT_642793 [Lentinula raphanica]|uniref:Uncharacterized protein n=1 Tax=Lentinula raphanica TaxID=153919 RepID=A0AA38P7B4_9AGAR|nr:hypothetical protein F5880DRAFT_1509564 [Lentinula raphanica]KAJ3837411.1 hypothetical protein F5878DRAFT_642793 [Lentinula raphanica]
MSENVDFLYAPCYGHGDYVYGDPLVNTFSSILTSDYAFSSYYQFEKVSVTSDSDLSPMVYTNFAYAPNPRPLTDWTSNSAADTPINPTPTSPSSFYLEETEAHHQNHIGHASSLYESSQSLYPLTPGKAPFAMESQVSDDTVAIGSGPPGLFADNPFPSTSSGYSSPLKRTVGSPKVKQQAYSKRKNPANFHSKPAIDRHAKTCKEKRS